MGVVLDRERGVNLDIDALDYAGCALAGYRLGLEQGRAGTRPTDAPNELVEFLDKARARGLRFFKGEFVTTDNIRISVDFAFDRERPAVNGGKRKGPDDE